MIIHLLNNSLQIIMIYAMNVKPSEMDKLGGQDQITWGMALISLVLTLVVANLIRKKPEEIVNFGENGRIYWGVFLRHQKNFLSISAKKKPSRRIEKASNNLNKNIYVRGFEKIF